MESYSVRFARWVMMLAVALNLAACDNSTEPAPASVVGNYELVQVNGQALPYVLLESPGQRITITAGLLQLRSDGGFSRVVRSEVVTNGVSDIALSEDEGRFSVNGDRIEFRPEDGGRQQATLAGETISYTIAGSELSATFVWRKQAAGG